MPEKLKIKITKKQLMTLSAYTLPYREKMKNMDPNDWDTGIFVMAGIYEELYIRAAQWGLLKDGEPKALPLANIEWFILAHELLRYCPEPCLNDLLLQLNELLMRKWRYDLYDFKRKHASRVMEIYFFLSNVKP